MSKGLIKKVEESERQIENGEFVAADTRMSFKEIDDLWMS